MLRDAEAVDDGRGRRSRIGLRSAEKQLARHARDGFRGFRRPGRNGLQQRREVFRARLDEVLLVPAGFMDNVHQAVEQGHVRAGAQTQMDVGQFRQRRTSRIGHNEPAARALAPHEPHAHHGMGHRGIGAHHQQAVAGFEVVKGVGHGAAAKGGGKTCHRGAVSEAGAMINIMRADGAARKFLQQIVFFVGAARRGQNTDAVRAVGIADAA